MCGSPVANSKKVLYAFIDGCCFSQYFSAPPANGRKGLGPMKMRILLSSFAALIALTILPPRLLADSFCSDGPPFQYEPCGVVAPTNIFLVNTIGLSQGVFIRFYSFHADFSDRIGARVFRNGQLVYTGPTSPSNQDMNYDQPFTLVPPEQLQAGDEIELMEYVPDGDKIQVYYSRAQDLGLNLDGVNHVWAENLLADFYCSPSELPPCVYLGFEEMSRQEGSDYDYNDFETWLYGVDFAQIQEQNPLSVSKVGSGTVSSTDGHIYCGNECSYSYTYGTQATLSAVPAPGYTFSGWTECNNVNGSYCSVTMTSAKNVTATFNSVIDIGLASLSFKPTYVQGGQLSAGTLTLSGPAPPGGLGVALSSDHPGVAHVPSFVIVPGGKTSVQFAVYTLPVKSNTTVTIMATAGASQVSGTLTVGTGFHMPAIK
jgi:uncharacterized repeat protein (TIGR02543 family)